MTAAAFWLAVLLSFCAGALFVHLLARSRGSDRAQSWLRWSTTGLLVAALASTAAIIVLPMWASVSNADAASRATMLARGISEAMNCLTLAALAMLVGAAVMGGWLVWQRR